MNSKILDYNYFFELPEDILFDFLNSAKVEYKRIDEDYIYESKNKIIRMSSRSKFDIIIFGNIISINDKFEQYQNLQLFA